MPLQNDQVPNKDGERLQLEVSWSPISLHWWAYDPQTSSTTAWLWPLDLITVAWDCPQEVFHQPSHSQSMPLTELAMTNTSYVLWILKAQQASRAPMVKHHLWVPPWRSRSSFLAEWIRFFDLLTPSPPPRFLFRCSLWLDWPCFLELEESSLTIGSCLDPHHRLTKFALEMTFHCSCLGILRKRFSYWIWVPSFAVYHALSSGTIWHTMLQLLYHPYHHLLRHWSSFFRQHWLATRCLQLDHRQVFWVQF